MPSDSDSIHAGQRHALNVLKVWEANEGLTPAMAFAGGIASGVSAFIAANWGPQAAFDLMTGIADDIINQSNVIHNKIKIR